MRYRTFYIAKLVFLLFLPVSVFAQTVCSDVGYTILTINGIFTDQREAEENKRALESFFKNYKYHGEKVYVDFLHNPSHIGGVGDMVKTLKQIMAKGASVDDFDLREMLRAASEKVGTRKILLVGHSQGNFYANGLYDILTSPLEGGARRAGDVALAVYAVATPAARVAGEGAYLTSSNDQVITELAAGVADAVGAKILPANDDIAPVEGDTSRGHSFSGVYLRERGATIVGGIERALGKLKTGDSPLEGGAERSEAGDVCFSPQPPTLTHRIKGVFYAAVDPAASGVRDNLVAAGAQVAGAARALARAAHTALSSAPIVIDNRAAGAAIATAEVYSEVLENIRTSEPAPPALFQRGGGEPAEGGRDGGVVEAAEGDEAERDSTATPAPELTRSQILKNLRIDSVKEEREEKDVLPIYNPIPLPAGVSPGFGGGGGGGSTSLTASGSFSDSSLEGGAEQSEAEDVEEPDPEPEPDPSYPSPGAGDIVINEIAWGGTEASPSHEWIELYNTTGGTLSLASTTLFAVDGAPYIALSGTIAPFGYYLIEADEAAVSDIAADLVADFGAGRLSDTTGEALTLAFFDGTATTTIDALDDFSCINWCGFGSASPYYLSVERLAPTLSGTEQASWGQNRGYQNGFRNGTAQDGTLINGTPRRRNYSNYLVNYGNDLTSGTLTLTAAGSPYLVDNEWFTIGDGASVSVEAGSVVKFNNTAGIRVSGTLTVAGSAATSTVFTSYADDEYGGDLNGDGAASAPSAGNWFGIEFLAGSSGAIDRATLRYGGKYFNSGEYTRAIFSAADSSPALTNSVIERSMAYGVSLAYASSTISGNTIRDNYRENDPSNSYGLYGYGGAPAISGNTFTGNYRGMLFWNASGAFTGNTFTNNILSAFTWAGDLLAGGSITNNSGSGNGGQNGIAFQGGNLASQGVSSVFGKNTFFPYLLLSTASIPSGASLTAGQGSVWKFNQFPLDVYGTLTAEGTAGEPVLFTSLYDDADGSDVHGNGSTTPPVYPNAGIYIQDGGSYSFSNVETRYINFATSTAPYI